MSEKKPRSFKIDQRIDDKLVALCDRLGVTVNAYLVGEIGKSVNRDFLAFQVADSQEAHLEKMFAALQSQLDKQEQE